MFINSDSKAFSLIIWY